MLLHGFLISLSLILSVILHEMAHGYVAYWLGDDTAKRYGRLSLSPIKHIDLFGSLVLPLFLWLSHVPFIFGWAKPVPVDYRNLKKRPRDDIMVAAAGIVMNLWLALIAALFLLLSAFIIDPYTRGWISLFWIYMITINVGLAVFNAIPIPPLDGSKILFGWIKKPWVERYLSSGKYGLIIMLFLLVILPVLGNSIGLDLDLIRNYMISATRYICSFLI